MSSKQNIKKLAQRLGARSARGSRERFFGVTLWYCKWFMLFMSLDMPDEGTR
jgi:hypothetical protein